MKLERKKFVNCSDVDITITDAFGQQYQLFPQEEKRLIVFVKEKKKDVRRRSKNSC